MGISTSLINEEYFKQKLVQDLNKALTDAAEPVLQEALNKIERTMREKLASYVVSFIENEFIVERYGQDIRILVKHDRSDLRNGPTKVEPIEIGRTPRSKEADAYYDSVFKRRRMFEHTIDQQNKEIDDNIIKDLSQPVYGQSIIETMMEVRKEIDDVMSVPKHLL